MNKIFCIWEEIILPVTVLPLASVTTTVSTVVGTVAVTGLPLASKWIHLLMKINKIENFLPAALAKKKNMTLLL